MCDNANVADGATIYVTVTTQVPDTIACAQSFAFNLAANAAYTTVPYNWTGPRAANTVTTTVDCTPASPFTIEAVGPATVRPGDTLTYTITFTNTSGRLFERVDFIAELFGGSSLSWSIDSSQTTASCSLSNTTGHSGDEIHPILICHDLNVADGTTTTATMTAQVPVTTACPQTYSIETRGNGTYTTIPSTSAGPRAANTVTTALDCSAADPTVSIALTGPPSVNPGHILTYMITVTNDTEVTAQYIDLLDSMPETASDWTIIYHTFTNCSVSALLLNCNAANVAAGESRTVTIQSTVPANPSAGLCEVGFSNQATGSARLADGRDTGVVHSNTVTTAVDCSTGPLGTIALTGPASVNAGDTLAYTITATNTSGQSALSLGAWDYLPDTGAEWTIAEDTFEGGCALQPDPTFLYCSIENAPDGASYSVTVQSVIPESPGETICANGLSNQANGDIWLGISDFHGLESGIVTTDVVCESPIPFTIVTTGPATIRPGDQLTYTYTVTNTSGRDFANIDLNSSLPASLTWSVVETETNATCIYTPDEMENYLFCYGTGVVDGAAMTVTVAATVPSGTACGTAYAVQARAKAAYFYSPPPPEYTDAFDSNTVTTNVVCTASIELAKSGAYAAPSTDAPFGAIDWTLTVTNTGDVPLTGVDVTDAGVIDLDCDPAAEGNQTTIASLDPGVANAVTCTATSPVSAGDGGTTVTNDALVTGFHGTTPVSDTASAEVSVPAFTGGIEVTKTVTNQPATGFDFGETVTYDITVTNTGDVPLFGATVSDDKVTDLDCGTGTTGSTVTLAQLDPGAANAVTCTASAVFPAPTAEQPHPNAVFANTVTVSAPFGDTTLADSATANATPGRTALSLTDRTEPDPVTAPGPVTSTYTVENIGTTTQLNLILTAPLPFDCDPGTPGNQGMPNTLAPGATVTCIATFEATQADIDAGDPLAPGEWHLTTFTGTPWFGSPIRTVVDQQPGLTLVKSVEPVAIDAAGDVTWSFVATNTGNVTLTNLVLDDSLVNPATVDCDPEDGIQPLPTSLAPQTTVTCTAVTTITQNQIDTREPLTNTAQVTSDQATSNTSSATLTITPRDGLGLVLSVTPGTVDAPGPVTWTYALTNNGTSTLTNLAIEDAALDPDTLDCDPADGIQPLPASLAPETSVTCISVQAIDQDQIDAGNPITREAVATSTETDSNQAQATVSIIQTPGIGLAKTVTSATSNLLPGDVVTYDIVLTNTGNVTVMNPAIEDTGADTLDCGDVPATLAPQATVNCVAAYTLTETDLVRGSYTNTVNAEATVGQGTADTIRTFRQPATIVVEATASATVTMAPVEVGLEIDKSVTPAGPVGSGTTLTYTFVVTNTGNLSLDNVAVSDPLPGLVWDPAYPAGVIGELATGETATVTATYVVTAADVATGEVTNTALGDGTWACPDAASATFRQVDATADCAVTSEPDTVSVSINPDPVPTPTPTPKAANDTAVTTLPTTGHGPGGMLPFSTYVGIAAALGLMVLAVTFRVRDRPMARSRSSVKD